MKRLIRHRLFFSLALALLIANSFGCSKEKKEAPASTVPVYTAKAATRTVAVQISAIGMVEACASVNVTSRVAGPVTAVNIEEGRMVQKGQLLFTIDDRPFQATLAAARAKLEQDRIRLSKARQDARRYADLLKKDYVTQAQAEQMQTDAQALEAAVRGGTADVESAQLNVSYCRIIAPIQGKAGAVLIHEGNLIKENDTANPLMVIRQVDPVFVRFAVPESALPEIRKRMAAGTLLEVQAGAPGEKTRQGHLTFLDNTIQEGSGTIDLKAEFDNTDQALWPGQFVNVALSLGTRPQAVVVPDVALQTGQDGSYVFVVTKEMTVALRNVAAGDMTGMDRVIESGLSPGEIVVTDGQLKLSPGTRVVVKNPTDAPKDDSGESRP